MSFSDSAAASAASTQPSAQDTQRLITLLSSIMPLLLRIQSQAFEPPSTFAPASLMLENPMLDHQAATSLVEDITADSLRMLSAYLDSYAEQYPGLNACVGLVTQAAHCFGARNHAQAFELIWQAYRVITALRASNPQLPPPRVIAQSVQRPTTQLH